jgi:integrase
MAWVESHRGSYRVRYRLDDGSIFTEHGFATQDDAENRATDIESDQRRHRFTDPRLAQTTIDEWIRAWTDAQHLTGGTWAKYDSHIRNHILTRWSGTTVGDITRINVKGWVNKTLRANLADKTTQDILILFSMILGEATDEGLIGTNPCRKLRISFADAAERPHASADEVDAIASRAGGDDDGLMIITGAYTGLRWGELAGLQWIRTYLDDDDPRIAVDEKFGALKEVRGHLELGPPKTAASVREVHLPPFLVDQLRAHRERNPGARFVFTGRDSGWHRRSNFRRRVWQPALAADPTLGWAEIQPSMHFHDLRHTHKTWLIEDETAHVLQLQRLGHQRAGDASGIYSHVTRVMIETMLVALQRRWDEYSTWSWDDTDGEQAA